MNPLVELNSLLGLFPEESPIIASATHVAASLAPEPYKSMLVHEHHMTVTMEEYHRCRVEVRVLDRKDVEGIYCRKILLLKEGTEDVVQFGIVRFNLEYVLPAVREEILGEEIPLGRVLINHNVLRHIDFGALLKTEAGPGLARHFRMQEEEVTYGRLATIFCNHLPAIDLLEISSPLS